MVNKYISLCSMQRAQLTPIEREFLRQECEVVENLGDADACVIPLLVERGCHVLALLDTGADVSFALLSCVKRQFPDVHILPSQTTRCVRTSGGDCEVYGCVELLVEFGGLRFIVRFIVLGYLNGHDFVVGRDTLARIGYFGLDLSKNEMYVNGITIPLGGRKPNDASEAYYLKPPITKENPQGKVRSAGKVPGCTALVPIVVPRSEPGTRVNFTVDESALAKFNVCGTSCVTRVMKKRFVYMAVNYEGDAIENVPHLLKVGYAVPMEEDDEEDEDPNADRQPDARDARKKETSESEGLNLMSSFAGGYSAKQAAGLESEEDVEEDSLFPKLNEIGVEDGVSLRLDASPPIVDIPAKYKPRARFRISEKRSFMNMENSKCEGAVPEWKKPFLPEELGKQVEEGDSILTDEQKKIVTAIFVKYAHIFARSTKDLGRCNLMKAEIRLTTDRPVQQRPNRVPHQRLKQVEKELQDMLDIGVIVRSRSPYRSSFLMVERDPGTNVFRFVLDPRALNDITIPDLWPTPIIAQLFDDLKGCKYRLILDMQKGFWQIMLDEASQQYTSFQTPFGSYMYTVMPFGIVNAGAIFQRCMDIVLGDLLRRGVKVYVDDVLIYAPTFEQFCERVDATFERIASANMKVKLDKVHVCQRKLKFVGYLLTDDVLTVDPDKAKKVEDWPRPQNAREVSQFLGLAGYQRRLVKNFSRIAKPLYSLAKGDGEFEWKVEHEVAFELLKLLITSYPVLGFPDWSAGAAPFRIHTDASQDGMGATLVQRQKQADGSEADVVIEYWAKAFSSTERNYPTMKREAYAIYSAVCQFHHYVDGPKEFEVWSDHKPLAGLDTMKTRINCVNENWITYLTQYNFKVYAKPGTMMIAAGVDALSRFPWRENVSWELFEAGYPTEEGAAGLSFQELFQKTAEENGVDLVKLRRERYRANNLTKAERNEARAQFDEVVATASEVCDEGVLTDAEAKLLNETEDRLVVGGVASGQPLSRPLELNVLSADNKKALLPLVLAFTRFYESNIQQARLFLEHYEKLIPLGDLVRHVLEGRRPGWQWETPSSAKNGESSDKMPVMIAHEGREPNVSELLTEAFVRFYESNLQQTRLLLEHYDRLSRLGYQVHMIFEGLPVVVDSDPPSAYPLQHETLESAVGTHMKLLDRIYDDLDWDKIDTCNVRAKPSRIDPTKPIPLTQFSADPGISRNWEVFNEFEARKKNEVWNVFDCYQDVGRQQNDEKKLFAFRFEVSGRKRKVSRPPREASIDEVEEKLILRPARFKYEERKFHDEDVVDCSKWPSYLCRAPVFQRAVKKLWKSALPKVAKHPWKSVSSEDRREIGFAYQLMAMKVQASARTRAVPSVATSPPVSGCECRMSKFDAMLVSNGMSEVDSLCCSFSKLSLKEPLLRLILPQAEGRRKEVRLNLYKKEPFVNRHIRRAPVKRRFVEDAGADNLLSEDIDCLLAHDARDEVEFLEFQRKLPKIAEEQKKDSWLNQVKRFLAEETFRCGLGKRAIQTLEQDSKDLYVFNDVLYYVSEKDAKRARSEADLNNVAKVVMPAQLQELALETAHGHELSGHQSFAKTYLILRSCCYWKNMFSDCVRFVGSCSVCQVHRGGAWNPQAFLQPMQSKERFLHWGIDLIGPLRRVSAAGHQWIWVAIDRATRWVETQPMTRATAKACARAFREKILCRFGTVSSCLTDNGNNLTEREFEEFLVKLHINHLYTSTHKASTNAITETANKSVFQILKRLVHENPRGWHEQLPYATAIYNTRVHGSTGFSPYQLVFGQPPKPILESLLEIPVPPLAAPTEMTSTELAASVAAEVQRVFDDASKNSEAAAVEYKRKHDESVKPIVYKIGDRVGMRNFDGIDKFSPALKSSPYKIVRMIGPPGQEVFCLVENCHNGKREQVNINHLRPWKERRQLRVPRIRLVKVADLSEDEEEGDAFGDPDPEEAPTMID